LDTKHLEQAISYAQTSENKFRQLIDDYGQYAQDKNLNRQIETLKTYKDALQQMKQDASELLTSSSEEPSHTLFTKRQEQIRDLGHKTIEGLERGLGQERQEVKRLVRESRLYLFLFLGVILIIALVTFLFLIVNVNRPLKTIEAAIPKIIQGDYQNLPQIQTGDEFERLVESLNTMLHELNRRSEQLIQSEKMAALGTLTSGVAHELNNPLNNISTSLQIILEELDEGDIQYQKQLLVETEGQVQRAQDIVKALLEFSRETEFSLVRVHFKNLVRQTLKLIQGEVPSNVQIDIDIPEDIECNIDARRIQQVLLNLIINGIQAMEGHGGKLTVQAYESEGGQGFSFHVRDTGKGMELTEQSKIFDPFYTTKDVGKGSGLGLSVSKGIIENHGGHISVSSNPGQSTDFTVYLPYAQSPQESLAGPGNDGGSYP
jgi:signal transduction histidine kinase